ncbi:olfactory receptor 2B8-like [Rhinoderma darwinii]|uniref:olfactory receptor 2B8-like n=1 Tax=Rhinoderma darwinii TaxID=43563 RepID=UPI003F680833
MLQKNGTVFTEFILLGLSSNPRTQTTLFVIFLIVYIFTVLGNVMIIVVTLTDSSLQTPMYFFITNLSFIDIFFSSSTTPRMLKDMLLFRKTSSLAECVVQMYIFLSLGSSECILLAIMAYDRYMAICYPLHYTTVMERTVCIKIATGNWISGFLLSIFHVVLIWTMYFCDNNKINHFVCEAPELLSLGCGNVSVVEFVIFVFGVLVLIIPIVFIITSYIQIIRAILKMKTSEVQQKTFSTCGSHMLVVTLFYGSAMAAYMKPRSYSIPNMNKILTVIYAVIIPMLNPLIYTLRNKEVKRAVMKVSISKVMMHILYIRSNKCNSMYKVVVPQLNITGVVPR